MNKHKKRNNKRGGLSFKALFLRKMVPCFVVVLIIAFISVIALRLFLEFLVNEYTFNNMQMISNNMMSFYYQVKYDENDTCNGKSREEVMKELYKLFDVYMNNLDLYNVSMYTGLYDKSSHEAVVESKNCFYIINEESNGLIDVSIFETGESQEFQRLLSKYSEENGKWFSDKYIAVEIRVSDIYAKDDKFIAGSTTLYGVKSYYHDGITGYSDLGNADCEIIGEYDFTPQDTSGYDHIIYRTENDTTVDNSFANGNNDISKYGKPMLLCRLNVNDKVLSEKENILKNDDIWNSTVYYGDPGSRCYVMSDIIVLGDREYVILRIMQFDGMTYFWLPLLMITGASLILGIIIVLIVTSLAYRKEKERQKFNSYRRTITGSMAHDLKSPLMVVSGYAENLMENVGNDKKNYYAAEILNNVEYMNELIENVLELSSLEDENVKLVLEELSVKDIISDKLDMYKKQIEEKNLTININAKATEEMKILADKKLANQLFDNLVGNAVKHSTDGGSIDIAICKNDISIENSTGPIDEKDIKKLCEPYFKGDRSRGGRSGSGLGLAIAKQIADMHGYDIKIFYEDGKFTVRVLFGHSTM